MEIVMKISDLRVGDILTEWRHLHNSIWMPFTDRHSVISRIEDGFVIGSYGCFFAITEEIEVKVSVDSPRIKRVDVSALQIGDRIMGWVDRWNSNRVHSYTGAAVQRITPEGTSHLYYVDAVSYFSSSVRLTMFVTRDTPIATYANPKLALAFEQYIKDRLS